MLFLFASELQTPEEIASYAEYVKSQKNELALVDIAGHPNTPAELLKELSQCLSVPVRVAVAGNINTPKRVLLRMAYHFDSRVRAQVVANPNTPEEILYNLVYGKCEYLFVRLAIAKNKKAPEILLGEAWKMLNEEILEKKKLPKDISKDYLDSIIWHFAANPNTPEHVIESIAWFDSLELKMLVLQHPKASRQALNILRMSAFENIRKLAQEKLEELQRAEI